MDYTSRAMSDYTETAQPMELITEQPLGPIQQHGSQRPRVARRSARAPPNMRQYACTATGRFVRYRNARLSSRTLPIARTLAELGSPLDVRCTEINSGNMARFVFKLGHEWCAVRCNIVPEEYEGHDSAHDGAPSGPDWHSDEAVRELAALILHRDVTVRIVSLDRARPVVTALVDDVDVATYMRDLGHLPRSKRQKR